MEISRDALLRVVQAARKSREVKETVNKLLVNPGGMTKADQVSCLLYDALYEFTGEKLTIKNDFMNDSLTMRALTNKMATDEEVTQMLLAEYWRNHPRQPKTHIIDREEMKKQAEAGCGYVAPEGDWK